MRKREQSAWLVGWRLPLEWLDALGRRSFSPWGTGAAGSASLAALTVQPVRAQLAAGLGAGGRGGDPVRLWARLTRQTR